MSLAQRPLDLLFVIYLIPAFALCVFRGLVRNLHSITHHAHHLHMIQLCLSDRPGLLQPVVPGLHPSL